MSTLGIAALLVFGLGIAVGRHLGDGATGAESGITPTSADATFTPSTHPSAPTSTNSAADASDDTDASTNTGASDDAAGDPTGPTTTAYPGRGLQTGVTIAPWPTARGACDVEVPQPILSGVRALRATTGLELLAGSNTRPLLVDDATIGRPLFKLAAGEFVSQLAVDSAGTVAVISDCDGYPPVRVVRRSPAGRVQSIRIRPQGYQLGSLITGGDRTWLSLYRIQPTGVAYTDSAILLQSTDGTDETVTLPNGFSPVSGSGDAIVGNWSDQLSSVYGPIQIYSLPRRGIVAQIGDASPQYAVGNGFVVWSAGNCSGSCLVHRYRIATGTESSVTVTAPADMTWQTVSPDGSRVVAITRDHHADPRFATQHPGGPTGLAVVNLSDGHVTTLPGIEMAPKSPPSMAFSADGRWLVIAFNAGTGTDVVLYDQELKAPLAPQVTAPGPTLWSAPLAVLPAGT